MAFSMISRSSDPVQEQPTSCARGGFIVEKMQEIIGESMAKRARAPPGVAYIIACRRSYRNVQK
jgi:hypothetical protein